MIKRLVDWLDERIRIRNLGRSFADRPIPGGASWFYVLGASLVFIFTLQMATGILLAMYYAPTPDHAYASGKYIQDEAPLGSFVRGLHHWGASFMMVIVGLHLVRVFVFGSYKKPREVVWLIGVGLIAIAALREGCQVAYMRFMLQAFYTSGQRTAKLLPERRTTSRREVLTLGM